MKGRLLFLGTGGSVGVPVIGCSCAVCRSQNPFNQRLRSSVLLQIRDKQFLIDVGPDFRLQALKHSFSSLDGVLLTHAHHDHTGGLDDLRPLYYQRKTPLSFLLSEATYRELRLRFAYMFQVNPYQEQFIERFNMQLLPQEEGEIVFEGITVRYMTYEQGGMAVNGFRFGNLAYISDIRHYQKTIFNQLEGVKYLILSALRHTSSPLHFSVDEAIDFAKEVKAEKVWLTHLSHELDHTHTNTYLPSNMCLAYDGLSIEFDGE